MGTGEPKISYDHLVQWMHRVHFSRKITIILICLAFISGIATYLTFTEASILDQSPRTMILLLNVDLVILLLLGVVVAKRLARVWAERKQGTAGSKLHVRLVVITSLLTVTPAIFVTVFSGFFLNERVESWFSQRIQTALQQSSTVAEAYLEEHKKVIRANVETMARDLARQFDFLVQNQELFNHALDLHAEARGLNEAIAFTSVPQILGKTRLSFSLEFEMMSVQDLERSKREVVIHTSENGDRVRALVQIDPNLDAFLLVGRFVDQSVSERIKQVNDAVSDYKRLEEQVTNLQMKFVLIFIMVCLLLLMISIWSALTFATRLARPISALIDAAEQVRRGDLTAQVDETVSEDELGSLSKAFNKMTCQLKDQQQDLIIANQQIDMRRQFIEDILKGVTAGVVGLAADYRIKLINPSALQMLYLQERDVLGQRIINILPEFEKILEKAKEKRTTVSSDQVVIRRKGFSRTLMVRVVFEKEADKPGGMIVTFDDITELVGAQRKAAWADVARRIAHEIRNPLTPIQLSAERLQRKYQKQIHEDPDAFKTCLETITRHVDHIGIMVKEFSNFARMPEPKMKQEDLIQLCQRNMALQQNAHQDIQYFFDSSIAELNMMCDADQIGQVITNLLQNAAEGIERLIEKESPVDYVKKIQIIIAKTSTTLQIKICDNGIGFPTTDREQLFEPYITHRPKGTGLGLAIVKKIVEDHQGALSLLDNEQGGAVVQINFALECVMSEKKNDK